jgi:hypothetical protein
MRKFLFVALVVALSLGTIEAYANGGPITRLGIDYSGYTNIGNCQINADDVHPTELRVKCRPDAAKAARIRYRFPHRVGGMHGPATTKVDIHQIHGRPCTYAWMDFQKFAPMTLRVWVPKGSYCHIRSVTWRQP